MVVGILLHIAIHHMELTANDHMRASTANKKLTCYSMILDTNCPPRMLTFFWKNSSVEKYKFMLRACLSGFDVCQGGRQYIAN